MTDAVSLAGRLDEWADGCLREGQSLENSHSGWLGMASVARKEAATLRSAANTIRELVAALKPFAKLGEPEVLMIILGKLPPLTSFVDFRDENETVLAKVGLEDLARARKALGDTQ